MMSMRSHSLGRRGMEMAVGTLVTMIVGIVIIIAGIVIVNMVRDASIDEVGRVTSEQQARIRALLSEGKLVAVYPASARLRSGDAYTFALGVQNVVGADQFSVAVTSPNVATLKKTGEPAGKEWTAVYFENPDAGRSLDMPIRIIAGPAVERGEYAFIVTVSYKDASGEMVQYDTPQLFTVTI
jgi:hypothetical protein